jgi:hypothetical protein
VTTGHFLKLFYIVPSIIFLIFLVNIWCSQELLLPVMEVGKWLISMIHWDDPMKSLVFCLVLTYVIWR